jgi:hypothetical protein
MRSKIAILLVLALLASAAPVLAPDYEEETTTSSLTVAVTVDITLSNVPISWGTLNPGTENNLAQANAGNPATVTVESTTNTLVDIYIKGTNWTYSSYTIGSENCKYDSDDNLANGGWMTLKTSYDAGPDQGFFEDVSPGTSKNSYWFISIPAGQTSGIYTNTIYFKAVKDGTTP